MTKRTFTVTAHWDSEAQIYYSESDIVGLHIEAATLEEFEELLMELGPELALSNHLLRPENASATLAEMIPTIIWKRPAEMAA
jgi:hypothetical protein